MVASVRCSEDCASATGHGAALSIMRQWSNGAYVCNRSRLSYRLGFFEVVAELDSLRPLRCLRVLDYFRAAQLRLHAARPHHHQPRKRVALAPRIHLHQAICLANAAWMKRGKIYESNCVT